ncbi:MAG: hypothetical protein ACI9FR_003283 [Cryomorphaceae bacterium]|jgi:hypothetical protein
MRLWLISRSKNSWSISLHSVLVSDTEGSILLPGASGSGKSNACLWLNHIGLTYHTDELAMINHKTHQLSALKRPFTLRKEAIKRLRSHLQERKIQKCRCLKPESIDIAPPYLDQPLWLPHNLKFRCHYKYL